MICRSDGLDLTYFRTNAFCASVNLDAFIALSSTPRQGRLAENSSLKRSSCRGAEHSYAAQLFGKRALTQRWLVLPASLDREHIHSRKSWGRVSVRHNHCAILLLSVRALASNTTYLSQALVLVIVGVPKFCDKLARAKTMLVLCRSIMDLLAESG